MTTTLKNWIAVPDAVKDEHAANRRTVKRMIEDASTGGGEITIESITGLLDALNGKANTSALAGYATTGALAAAIKGLVLDNDSRLTDARTPLAHAASHAPNGSDALTGYATLDERGKVPASQLPSIESSGSGIDVWQEDKYYAPPKLLFGSDNNLYKALAESGPGTDVGVRDPVSEPVEYGVDISGIAATLPTSTNWISIACGGSVFVVIGYNSNKAAYSTDGGKTWSAATLPSSANWRSVTYGDGVFVVVADGNSGKTAYSIDGGKTWTAVSMSVSADWRSVTYGNGVFVAVDFSGNKVACSTDGGKTWAAATLPSSASWLSITHGDGVFVAVAYNSNKAAYSTDGGKTWAAATLPVSVNWRSVTYGDGVFVAVATTGNTVAYSADHGKTWSIATLPLSADWYSVAYGKGVFVAVVGYSSNKVAYSIDKGKTWLIATLPLSASWRSIAYGDDAFAIVADSLNKASILTINATFLPDCWKLVA